MTSPAAISLSPELFAEAFPFHLAVDHELRILQTGRSLPRLVPAAQPGAWLPDLFRLKQPNDLLQYERLIQHPNLLVVLEYLAAGVLLRGQVLAIPDQQTAVFLGSPWFTDINALHASRLNFADFAVHDPIVDLLQVLHYTKVSLNDAKRLAEDLAQQRSQLRTVNQQLSDQNAALRDAEERLRRQEAESRKLAMIAARTDNAVILTGADGCIQWVNDGFTRLTGYTPAEVEGRKPGHVLQGPGTDSGTVEAMRQCLARGEGFSAEVLNSHRDGRKYWLAIEVQPIHDQHGQLTNFTAIEADVTSRRQAQHRLAAQYLASRILGPNRRAWTRPHRSSCRPFANTWNATSGLSGASIRRRACYGAAISGPRIPAAPARSAGRAATCNSGPARGCRDACGPPPRRCGSTTSPATRIFPGHWRPPRRVCDAGWPSPSWSTPAAGASSKCSAPTRKSRKKNCCTCWRASATRSASSSSASGPRRICGAIATPWPRPKRRPNPRTGPSPSSWRS